MQPSWRHAASLLLRSTPHRPCHLPRLTVTGTTQKARWPVFDDEAFEFDDEILRGAMASDAHRQRFSGVFVDDVRQLQPASVDGLVELEGDRPHVIRSQRSEPFGAVGPDAPSFPQPLLALPVPRSPTAGRGSPSRWSRRGRRCR